MLGDPRMVGGALQGVVEGQLHALGAHLGHQIGKSPRWFRGRDGWRYDRPRRLPMAHGLPGSSPAATSVLLGPFRSVTPDRVDRRQVQDVEAHGGHVGHPGRRRLQPPERPRETARTTPRTGPARGPPTAAGAARTVRSGAPSGPRRAAATAAPSAGPHAEGLASRAVIVEGPQGGRHRRVGRRAGRSNSRPSSDLDVDGLPGVQFGRDLVGPGGVPVGPRLDHEPVRPDPAGNDVDSHSSLPSGTRSATIGVTRGSAGRIPVIGHFR